MNRTKIYLYPYNKKSNLGKSCNKFFFIHCRTHRQDMVHNTRIRSKLNMSIKLFLVKFFFPVGPVYYFHKPHFLNTSGISEIISDGLRNILGHFMGVINPHPNHPSQKVLSLIIQICAM